MFARYQAATGGKHGVSTFEGVSFQELNEFEKCFQCNIYVYELEPNVTPRNMRTKRKCFLLKPIAKLLRRSHCRFPDSMYVNYHESHFSYVKDMNHTFSCPRCRRLFKQN